MVGEKHIKNFYLDEIEIAFVKTTYCTWKNFVLLNELHV